MQLIVLGMHRSGTSVLMRMLNLMGAYFGPEGISTGANAENPKGFWERRDVRKLNDWLLLSIGCDWNRLSGFDLNKVTSEVRNEFKDRAGRLILEMDAHRPWAMKEPRLCLTLPLWREVLEAPVVIHIVRDPVEVACSLRTRNKMPLPVGLTLWEIYARAAVQSSQGLPCAYVQHHSLMEDPVKAATDLYRTLGEFGVKGLRPPSEREISGFVSKELYRERRAEHAEERELASSQIEQFHLLETQQLDNLLVKRSMNNAAQSMLAEYEAGLPPLPDSDTVFGNEDRVALRVEKEVRYLRQLSRKLAAEFASRDEEFRSLASDIRSIREEPPQVATIRDALERRINDAHEHLRLRDQRVRDLESDLRDTLEQSDRRGSRIRALEQVIAREEVRFEQLQSQYKSQLSTLETRIEQSELRYQSQLKEKCEETVRLGAEIRLAQESASEQRYQWESEIAEYQSSIRALEQSVRERFHETEQLTRMLMSLETRYGRLDAASSTQEKRLAAVLESSSWRFTAPLRLTARSIRSIAKVRHVMGRRRDMRLLRQSKFFDSRWYRQSYPDVAGTTTDPVAHYLDFGASEGRDPGPAFSTKRYLSLHKDVAAAGLNPLLHYLRFGLNEGRAIR